MITKQKHNEALRKARRERAQYVRDKYMEYGVRSYVDFKPAHKQLNEEDRLAIRDRIRADLRRSQQRSIITFVAIILLLGF